MIKGIVAVAKDYGIGKANGLLFNLPADMKFFRETTKGNIVVFGKSTYDSLSKRPLPGRVNVVLWDQATSLNCLPGAITFNNFYTMLNFLQILAKQYDVFICGGASIYRLFMPYYDEVFVTYIDAVDSEATAFFPDLSQETSYYIDRILGGGQENGLNYEFRVYKRALKGDD